MQGLFCSKEDFFLALGGPTLQFDMPATRRTVHGENDLGRAVDLIAVLQYQEVRSKLGDPKPRAILHDVHFHFCRVADVIPNHG